VRGQASTIPISKLKLDTLNANRGSDRGREMLKASLRRYGAIRISVQFGQYRKVGKSHQDVLVFFCGNPKQIPLDLGTIEIAESPFEL
jgi:hypothetical protein